jgi:molybdopterin converting factor small subunit
MPDDTAAAVLVFCFGVLRERLGAEVLERERSPRWQRYRPILPPQPLRRDRRQGVGAARNLSYCDYHTPVQTGAELVFMPPVSGGIGGRPLTRACAWRTGRRTPRHGRPGHQAALCSRRVRWPASLACSAGRAGDGRCCASTTRRIRIWRSGSWAGWPPRVAEQFG